MSLSITLNHLPLPALALDVRGTVVDMNPRFAALLGLERAAAIGVPLSNFLDAETARDFVGGFKPIPGQPPPAPLAVTLVGGGARPFRLCFEWGQGCLIGMVCEVCKAYQTEVALHESEKRLELALEATGIGLWDHDFGSDTVERNAQWSAMLGYAPEEIDAQADFWRELIHPEDRERTARVAEKHEKGDSQIFQVEHRLRTKSGAWKWVLNWGKVISRDGRGNPVRAMGAHIDIHERKVTEMALEEMRALMSQAEELAEMGSFEWEIDSDNLVFSPGFVRLLCIEAGMDKKALLGRIHPEDRERIRSLIRQFEENEISSIKTDLQIVMPDGLVKKCLARAMRFTGLQDDVNHLIGVVQDVSELRNTEARLSRLVEEKEWLLKEMHHRVKNNFQIVSSLMSLQSQAISDEGTQAILKMSQARIHSMALLHETLYKSRDLGNILMPDYFKGLIRTLCNAFMDRSKEVQLDLDLEDIRLSMDKAVPLGLILNELLTNALKHAFPASHQGERRVQLALRREGGEGVRLTLADNGVGFDPSVRGEESLGLKLVRILVEDQLEGRYQIIMDKGARFDIDFDP